MIRGSIARRFCGILHRYHHDPLTVTGNGCWIKWKNEFRSKGNASFTTATNTCRPSSVDTLIIGGGPIGASTAFHLAMNRHSRSDCSVLGSDKDGGASRFENEASDPSILVVERDPSYQSGSAIYSAGGIRLQFSLAENVLMSLYSIEFLRNCNSLLSPSPSSSQSSINVEYVENGYLFLASSEAGEQQLRDNFSLFKQLGCSDMIELLSPAELRIRFPWLRTDDVRLGSFGCSGEGWFDPWAYIQALNSKNKASGVRYEWGTVVGATRDPESGNVATVCIRDKSTNEFYSVQVKNVVNAAGAAANEVLKKLGGGCSDDSSGLLHPLPVRPRKRSVYFFHCERTLNQKHDDGVGSEGDIIVPDLAPLTIDSTGAYFRSEGTRKGTGKFLCGISPPSNEDHDCYDERELENADPHQFERYIWPALYNRVPAFGSIKVQSSWAGLYEYNILDQNCIIDFHPEMENVLMINGFSGHGLQHSPAAGRAGAELIEHGNRFVTLNLDIFRFDRLLDGGRGLVLEKGIY